MKSFYGVIALACLVLLMPCLGCNRASPPVEPGSSHSSTEPRSDDASSTTPPDRSATSSSTSDAPKEPTHDSVNDSGSLDRVAVERLMQGQRFDEAKQLILAHLLSHPTDPPSLFLLAQVQAASGELDQAISTLDQPAIMKSDAALPALGQSAAWALQLGKPNEAEDRFRQILKVLPSSDLAHRALSDLMLRTGRPQEAVPSIRLLCRHGNVKQSELAVLVIVDDAYNTPEIGRVVEARKLATQRQYAEAIGLIEPMVSQSDAPDDVEAFYLRLLAESQQSDALRRRLSVSPLGVEKYADYWAAIGALALSRREGPEAVGALVKALTIDSTDSRSIQRMRQALLMCGEVEEEQRWSKTYRIQHKAILQSNKIASLSPQDDAKELANEMLKLADLLDQLGRRIESSLWRSMAAHHRGADAAKNAELRDEFQRQVAATHTSPNQGFPSVLESRGAIDWSRFPAPSRSQFADDSTSQSIAAVDTKVKWPAPVDAQLNNVAMPTGLKHEFKVSAKPQRDGFTIFQTMGGGIAVLDFDRDGWLDLYLAQGDADPPTMIGQQGNQLLRNQQSTDGTDRHSRSWQDVGTQSNTNERAYTTGVTAGDWNHDGLDDLAVNQFGAVVVLTNNGDGTFRRDVVWQHDLNWLPASVAMADADNDGWVDLVVLGYADNEMIYLKPPRDSQGRPTQSIGPSNFAGGENQFIAGSSTSWNPVAPLRENASAEAAKSTSLGVVVGPLQPPDDDNDPIENQIFIGNDQQNNRLWICDGRNKHHWREQALVKGVAYGNFGNATAAMGIATSDLNQDGFLDLHITNYQTEPVSLYLGNDNGFVDQTVRKRLHKHSMGVLGFGCVATDYDLNGLPDLLVTNGHVDDTTETNDPFEQPMQLFAIDNGAYHLVNVNDSSGYWQRLHVGRGMVKLDFDRDGRQDVVVTNLNEPSALLANRTSTKHHWLRLDLVGTRSARWPVGAQVTVKTDRQLHHWIVAGDGYLCRDEPTLHIGLGEYSDPVDVTVKWPVGSRTRYRNLASDQHWQLTEGDNQPFAVGH